LCFAPPAPVVPEQPAELKPPEKKPRRKNDPKLVAAARELRDRWLERVNAEEYLLEGAGKYDATRALLPSPSQSTAPIALLPAA
jgi:hypothetical protein